MTTIRIAVWTGIASFLCLWGQPAGVADEPVHGVYGASADAKGLISAPVIYGDAMLIVTTREGVAAIAFREKDPGLGNKSATYRFRFLKDAKSAEVTGTGRVLDTVQNKERLTIKAGPIRLGWLGWLGSAHDRGWIYYRPEEMRVSIADARRFEDSFVADVDGFTLFDKLDLKRFLKDPQ